MKPAVLRLALRKLGWQTAITPNAGRVLNHKFGRIPHRMYSSSSTFNKGKRFYSAKPKFDINKDYYAVLGLKSTATIEEIRKAYRSVAKTCHPDINPSENAQRKFTELSAAYQILSGKERAEYDLARSARGNATRTRPRPNPYTGTSEKPEPQSMRSAWGGYWGGYQSATKSRAASFRAEREAHTRWARNIRQSKEKHQKYTKAYQDFFKWRESQFRPPSGPRYENFLSEMREAGELHYGTPAPGNPFRVPLWYRLVLITMNCALIYFLYRLVMGILYQEQEAVYLRQEHENYMRERQLRYSILAEKELSGALTERDGLSYKTKS